MKKIVLFSILCTLCFITKAQNASDLLNKTINTIKSSSTVSLEIDYSMKNTKANIDETMSGKAWLKKTAYRLDLNGQEIYCDGTTTWTYIAESNEVMIATVEDNDQNPFSLLEKYQKNVNTKLIKNSTPSIITIEITPKEKNDKFSKMRLNLDAKAQQPKSVVLYDENGTEFTFTIKNIKTNEPLDDTFFKFDTKAHKGVDVIDMR